MSKMKRIVSFVLVAALLVTTCLTDGFGAWAAEGDGTTISTNVQAVWSNFSGENRLTFRLSVADYAKFGGTERPVSAKVQEYDYGDKIELTYADGSVKKLKEVWQLDAQYCNTWGWDSKYGDSISMPVTNGNQVVRVSIPAGTNFPSIAYTGATAWNKDEVNAGGTLSEKKSYQTTADVTFDCSNRTTTLLDDQKVYVWHQSTVTTPSKIELLGIENARNILAIYPTVNDYPLPEIQTDGSWVNNSVQMNSDTMQQFTYLSNVYLTNKNGETKTLADVVDSDDPYIHYNLWTTHKSFSVRIDNASFCADNLTKVVFKKGCQIPGWDAKIATNKEGKTLKTYVLQEDFTYTYENSQWKLQEVAPSEVTVDKLVLGHNNLNVGFILSATDYANGINNNEAINVEKSQEYNFWDKIQIYYGDTSLSLKEAYDNASSKEAMYKMWTDPKWINISVKEIDQVTKIVVPEGTVFPSALYTNKGYIGKGGFKTTVNKVFVKTSEQYGATKGFYWEEQVIKDEATTISKISVESGKLIVTLSNHDYPETKATVSFYNAEKLKAYKLLDYIELSTGTETKKLGEVLTENGEDAAYINLWQRNGTVGFTLKSGWDGTTIKKIAFLEGCEFPSYDSIINNAEKKSYYLENKIAYKTSTSDAENTNWVIDYGKQDIATEVTALEIPNPDDNNNAAFVKFTLSANDYTGLATKPINEKAAYLNDYNLTEKVILTKTDGSTVALKDVQGSEAYYNLWSSPNCVAIRMKSNHTEDMFTRVTIPKGTEFPAYAYTSETNKCRVGYVTTDEIAFEKVKGVWKLVKEHEDRDTSVEKIEVRAADEETGADTRILVYLTEHDYTGVETNTPWNSKYTDYNFKEKIMLTTTDGVKTLADALNTTGAFSYNTWSETGCVGIPLASGYTKNNITQITIPEGTEFPAYAYTKQEGNPKTLISYVTTKDIIIKRMGDSTYEWQKINVADTETKISNITVANTGVTFTLTESDYTSTTNVSDKHMDFDYWKNVKVYKNSEAYSLEEWADSATISYGTNTVTIGKNATELTCVVVPAKTTFPSSAYTSGTLAEAAGYRVNSEVVYKKQSDGSWKDISMGVSYSSGDTNGDGEINSLDLITMAKYLNNGYGYNTHSLTYDSSLSDADNRGNVRKVIVGMSLHNYEKESDTMTYFASSDNTMDNFLNNYFLRHIGYYDYKEGDMKVGSYSIGTWFEGVFNHNWNMEAVSWMNLSDDFKVDRKDNMRYITSSIVVDKYGYVWDGMDTVEPTTGTFSDNKHTMGWPFPNASETFKDGLSTKKYSDDTKYWDFNSSNDSWKVEGGTGSISNGIFTTAASNQSSVSFSITGKNKLIDRAHAPYLAFDLRMSGVIGEIDDIYVYYTTTSNGSFSDDIKVSVKDLAPLTYDYSTAANTNLNEAYAHMTYLPMYTQSNWYEKDEGSKYIYGIKIEIVAKSGQSLSGNFGLNYVRPYYDTRYSDNNGNYISAVREYYDATGDTEFLKESMTKVRKAIGFYLQMYDKNMQLIDLSYMQGHDGDKTKVYQGISNGYYDVLYTPVYDFAANMYFCKALEDVAYLEQVVTDKNITVSGDATIKANKGRAKGSGIEEVNYTQDIEYLNKLAATVKTKIQTYFWDASAERFFAGYSNSTGKENANDKVDYGYLMWNLEAVELGIANSTQAKAITKWVNGDRTISGDNDTDIYKFELAPRVTTKKLGNSLVSSNGIFNAYYKYALSTGTQRAFGEKQVQYGGANMYTSYYDLVNRVNCLGADNALGRLNGIKTWYQKVQNAYESKDVTPFNFYENYYSGDYKAQSGAHNSDNGVIGIQGEFTESLLTLSAIPKGFFGIKQGADVLTVEPSLPSTMDRWKIENMEFANVLYDLSIYKDAIRIDSVRGDATGLTVKVILACKDGQNVYVNGVKEDATIADGKATVTVPLTDTLVEVK